MAVADSLRTLDAQLAALDALVGEGEEKLGRRAPRVSGWSVAQQIDHIAKVLDRTLVQLLEPARRPTRGINLLGRVLLGVGRLPRGAAQSPSAVRGEERPAAELAETLARVRTGFARLVAEGRRFDETSPVFPHPFFGGLTPAQTLRFLAIHTDHHLRIITDIRAATGA